LKVFEDSQETFLGKFLGRVQGRALRCGVFLFAVGTGVAKRRERNECRHGAAAERERNRAAARTRLSVLLRLSHQKKKRIKFLAFVM